MFTLTIMSAITSTAIMSEIEVPLAAVRELKVVFLLFLPHAFA